MFARRPAPVQVGYLAYPASSGMRAHDFRITDPQLDAPADAMPSGPETPLWLPHSYLCYRPAGDWLDVRSEPPCASNGYVTFGALNNFAKNNTETLRLWARVLDAVAGSRLVLVLRGGLEASPSLRERFREAGLDPERVTVLDRAPSRRDYLDVFNLIDIALDPFPYSGHTTAFDALLMGVPIVALHGASALGRGGVTALHQVGLDDLVARDANDYVNLAASLASDPARLTNLRHELRPRLLGSPAADAAGVTRSLEELYQQMWRAHGGGDAC
jgi:predicted O-linked N-acetylglucosamine transferase (SPINDLY family)